MASNLTPIMK
jgi:hypothetical protein